MQNLRRSFLALLLLSLAGLSSCGKKDPEPEPEVIAVEDAHQRMKEQLAELENEAEKFRDTLENGLNQQVVDQLTPEEVEALRNSNTNIPEGVELPPEE